MILSNFGEVKYSSHDRRWFGNVLNISPHNKVELSIPVENKDEDLQAKITLIEEFAAEYESIMKILYDFAYKKYEGTQYEVKRVEVETMYCLIGVELEQDNRTWNLILEPHFNVHSIYNHYLRFTMIDKNIIWPVFTIEE